MEKQIHNLEAFAEYLHAADPKLSASDVLAEWLWKRISLPPLTSVDRVLHREIAINQVNVQSNFENLNKQLSNGNREVYVFRGVSPSGKRLLASLYEYCLSYEQQQWSRWVHTLKASDFTDHLLGPRQ